jgi:hypothetical protein
MAFECDHCGFRNSEVQSADSVAEKGVIVSLKCKQNRVSQRYDGGRMIIIIILAFEGLESTSGPC